MTDNRATGEASPSSIRRAEAAADWRAIRELCCRTGAAGDAVDVARRPFFAQLRIGPYETCCPGWTYVAVGSGRIDGYLTGCPDTAAFRRACRFSFALPLLLDVARGRYAWNADTRLFVGEVLRLDVRSRLDRAPLRYGRVMAACPAHLHMNVDAGHRRGGIGRALMLRYFEDLRGRGVPGVHLMCGDGPLGFYARLGFRSIGSWRGRTGARRHLLAHDLTPAPPG